MSEVSHPQSSPAQLLTGCVQLVGDLASKLWSDLSQRSPAQLLKLYLQLAGLQALGKLGWKTAKRLRMSMVLHSVPKHNGPSSKLLGIFPQLMQNTLRFHDFWGDLTRGLPICTVRGFYWQADFIWICLRDPKLIKYAMKDGFDDITKPDPRTDLLSDLLCRFLGRGIFTLRHGKSIPVENAEWSQQRKVAATIFTKNNFSTNMGDVFTKKSEALRQYLEPGKPIDMQLLFFNFTMDSILKVFYGEDSNTVGGEENQIGKHYDIAHRAFFEYRFAAFGVEALTDLLPWPWGGKDGICMNIHARLSPIYKTFTSSVAQLDHDIHEIITKCRADPLLPKRCDMMALFLQATEKDGLSRNESDRYLRDVCMNMTIAGRDTTACTLSWMFYLLATHPDLQQRVSEEVLRCVPRGTMPTLKDLHHANMPLLNAILFETLRLHPAVPVMLKEAAVDTVLPGGQKVPQGTKVRVMVRDMGRDPSLYPEPERVKLERWIPFKKPGQYEFPVFNGGPRLCLGQDMAIFEMKVVTCALLQEFSFTLLKGEEDRITYSLSATMAVCNSKKADSHNLWLIPHRRDDKKEAPVTAAACA